MRLRWNGEFYTADYHGEQIEVSPSEFDEELRRMIEHFASRMTSLEDAQFKSMELLLDPNFWSKEVE